MKATASQINLAPLLDIVFVTLFVVVIGMGHGYRDDLDAQDQAHQENLRGLENQAGLAQARLRQARARVDALRKLRLVLEEEKNGLLGDLSEVHATLLAQEHELDELRAELAGKEARIASLSELMEKVKSELEDKIGALESRLADYKRDVKYLNLDLSRLRGEIDALLAEKQQLHTELRGIAREKQQLSESLAKLETEVDFLKQGEKISKQRILEYRRQLARIEAKMGEPVATTLKAEFVDKYINLYTLSVDYNQNKQVGTLSLSGRGGKPHGINITGKQQVRNFLSQELSHYEKDKTLILLMKSHDSRYRHEKWVENYLQEHRFQIGQGRRD